MPKTAAVAVDFNADTDLITFLKAIPPGGPGNFPPPPSDSTFRLLLAQLDVEGVESLLQQWMAAQPGVAETVDTLVCDGKTLRGSIDQTASGAARFIAQAPTPRERTRPRRRTSDDRPSCWCCKGWAAPFPCQALAAPP